MRQVADAGCGVIDYMRQEGLGTEPAKRMAPVIMQFGRGKVGAETAERLDKALRAGF